MKTIILTGGGTGGHVIPHLSLLPYIKKDFNKIIYIGTNGIEKEIISKQKDITFETITATKFKRDCILKNLLIPFKLISSINQAKKILKKYKPDVIFSKGGFVSVPVCIAGKLLKIPIISHESDLTIGLANKIIYSCCNTFCTSFEQTSKNLDKAVFTGSPIRKELFYGNKENAYQLTKISKVKPTILVMGGSTGALKLNETLYKTLPELLKKYNIIHLVGKNKGNSSIKYINYCQIEFCHNIEDLFAISDIIISRAGSNAIFEFLALKKPTILIPLPKQASRGDQIDNANYFTKKGYAKTIFQESLTPQTLIQTIKELEENKQTYIENMSKAPNIINGAENIYHQILHLTFE